MKFTIEQRRKVSEVSWHPDQCYVDCVIEFSDLERARINQDPDRFLTYVVSAGYDAPPESNNSPRNIKMGAFFLLVMALLVGASAAVDGAGAGSGYAVLLFAAALGSWLYGIWFDYEGYRACDEVRLGAIMNEPRLVLYAETWALADQTAADLRERLNQLDAMLASG